MTWRTFADYLEALDAARPAINVASLVPNGNLRIAATGFDERPASPDEINQMTRLLGRRSRSRSLRLLDRP